MTHIEFSQEVSVELHGFLTLSNCMVYVGREQANSEQVISALHSEKENWSENGVNHNIPYCTVHAMGAKHIFTMYPNIFDFGL